MRDPVLPSVLLTLGIGLLLGFRTVREQRLAIAASVIAAGFGTLITTFSEDYAFTAAWIAMSISAAVTWLDRRTPFALALIICVAAGAIVGCLLHDWRCVGALGVAGVGVLASATAIARARTIAIKVIAGWLMATAVLNGALTMLPVTPGYLPDHLE